MKAIRLLPLPLIAALSIPGLAAETTVQTPRPPYQLFRDEPPQNWRESNDKVARIGGWRAYLREAQRTNKPVTTAPEPERQP